MKHTKAALIWITDILMMLNIPFQISGGLAAKAYGAARELADIDIDIPDAKFALLKPKITEFIIFGPERIRDEKWDLLLLTLNYQGQEIDLSGSSSTKIFNNILNRWEGLVTDFATAEIKQIYGLELPIMKREALIAYKKVLARAVDIADIAAIS